MLETSFFFVVWVLLCASAILVWRIGLALCRPFDAPLAYAITMTALAVVQNAADSAPAGLLVNVPLSFGLYYATAWLMRAIWRLGLVVHRQLRLAEADCAAPGDLSDRPANLKISDR